MSVSADPRLGGGPVSPAEPTSRVAPVIVLSVALSAAAITVVVTLVMLALKHTEDHERTSWLLSVVACAVCAPLAALLARRLPGPSGQGAGVVSFAVLAAGLALSRVLKLGNGGALAAGIVALLPVAAAAIRPGLGRLAARTPVVPVAIAAAGAILGGLAFAGHPALETGRLLLAAALGLLAALVTGLRRRYTRLGPRTGLVLDVVVWGSAALIAMDLNFYQNLDLGHHQSFYIGPANDVLHGRAMLVETFSQYGVGVIYFLAGMWQIVPVGYGTLTLLMTILLAVQTIVLLAVLRLAGVGRLLSWIATAVFLIAVVFGQILSPVEFPSTGFLRFGPPWVVLLIALVSLRYAPRDGVRDRLRRGLWILQLVVVGIAAVWAVEAAATTFFVAVGTVLAGAITSDLPRRAAIRWAVLRCAQLVGAVIVGIIALTLLTALFAGDWPEYRTYINMVRAYATEGFGTLLIPDWSVGLVVGWIPAASLVVAGAVALATRTWAQVNRVAFIAIVGLSVNAALSFQYFLGRSHPNNVLHVAPPVIALCAVWLAVALREQRSVGARRLMAGTAVALAALATLPAVPALRAKWSSHAFAAAVPLAGGEGNTSAIARVQALWRNPPVNGDLQPAIDLTNSFGKRPVVMLLAPEASVEALVRSDRADALPMSDANEDVLSPESSKRILSAVPKLKPGTVVIADTTTIDGAIPPWINPLQASIFQAITGTFRTRPAGVAAGGGIKAIEIVGRK